MKIKKNILIVLFVVLFIVLLGCIFYINISKKEKNIKEGKEINNTLSIANPASTYCIEQGGKSEIRNNLDGQVGICVFNDGSECDEWAFFRKECQKGQAKIDIEKDTELIAQALVKKDKIDLSEVKIVIKKDTGLFASGSILPIQEGIGGAYFFAAKVDDKWNIVASGNGQIDCNIFDIYKDFPASMISECVNEKGEIENR